MLNEFLKEIFEITTNTRIHWVYLIPTVLISLLYVRRLNLFNFKYFWNQSSKLDLKLFLTNRIFKFFFILPFEVAAIYQVCKLVLSSSNLPNLGLNLSSTSALVLYTSALFVFDDFLRFIQHYIMHKVPALWEIHKVHHSAHTLNPMSLYRVHFIEVGISAIRRIFGTTVLTCTMFVISTQSISGYQIAGALAFNFIFNVLGGNLRHSHIPLSFGFLERIFISPLQHQIHHSKNSAHFDKNFGVALSVWDQIFKTWHKGRVSSPIKVGLSYNERNHTNDLVSALFDPLKTAGRKIFKIKSKQKTYRPATPADLFLEPSTIHQPILSQKQQGELL
jgi:sterol desaturase/sphingolipid hydroxylase (fatty acid hydroxylase superfamily)